MFNEAVITTAGLALDAKIRAGEAVAEFTDIKLGDGQYDGTEDLNEATTLKSIKQTFGISSIKRTNETTVRLRIIADNSGMTEGYYISEIGVYAVDPDEGEILYSIATGMNEKMDYQPSEEELEGATSTIDIFTSVSNAKAAIISTGTGAAASAEELADLEVRTTKLETPAFDDSGSVTGIAGFPDFLSKIVSKMNVFQFYRDLKAGLQFVLHAGQLVNNCTSTAADLPLAAAQGKVLMDLITQLNSNLNSRTPIADLFAESDIGIACKRIVLCEGTTLNTPFKAGLTGNVSAGVAYINMSNSVYGSIIYITSGDNRIFIAYKARVWSAWSEILKKGEAIKHKTITKNTGSEGAVSLEVNATTDVILSCTVAGDSTIACQITRWGNAYFSYCKDVVSNTIPINKELTFEVVYASR